MSDQNDLLNKIYDKVEKIDDKMAALDVTTVRQQVILDEHMRRTEILEGRTDKMFEELKPLKSHIALIDGGVKIIAGSFAVISAILGTLRFFGKI